MRRIIIPAINACRDQYIRWWSSCCCCWCALRQINYNQPLNIIIMYACRSLSGRVVSVSCGELITFTEFRFARTQHNIYTFTTKYNRLLQYHTQSFIKHEWNDVLWRTWLSTIHEHVPPIDSTMMGWSYDQAAIVVALAYCCKPNKCSVINETSLFHYENSWN